VKDAIRALGWRIEVLVVLLLAFGISISTSLWYFLHHDLVRFSSARLWRTLAFELCAAAVLAWFFSARGASIRLLIQPPSRRDLVAGIGLAIAVWIAYTVIWITSALVVPGSTRGLRGAYLIDGNLGLLVVLLISVVNPAFEEILVCGYLLSRLTEKINVNAAIGIGVLVRLLYHLYQGPIACLSVIPMGAIYGMWYTKTRRIWPLIIAHGILDFLAFAPYI
jgi:uncharacterized protein